MHLTPTVSNLSCQSCIPKQIDLTPFLLLQLPYCVNTLLLTRACKSAPAQYKCLLLISACIKTLRNHVVKRLIALFIICHSKRPF